jgi:hypothetical protein
MPVKILGALLVSICFANCNKNNNSTPEVLFDSIPTSRAINPMINETSGIADSKTNVGYLWAHEDSGNPTQLYLIKHDGTVSKKIFIKGVVNRDWEEMALVNNDIYIADIGDNNSVHSESAIYKFAEPASSVDTIRTIETIRFQYADGPHDAEAFLVDPSAKHIYIITKRDNPSRVYKISFPYSAGLNTATFVFSLPYTGVVSATTNPDAKEIILKTYSSLFYYSRSSSEGIEQALQKSYKTLGYQTEPQGEAIAFAQDGSGFFTLSEKGFASWVNLYFYKRK